MEIGCEHTYWADAVRRERQAGDQGSGGKVAPMSSSIFSPLARRRERRGSRYTIANWGEKLPHKTACQSAERACESDKQTISEEAD